MANHLIQSCAYSTPPPLTSPLFVVSRTVVCTSTTLLCLEMKQTSATDLIHDILADEVTDSHELLRPFLICVPSTQLHRDCAASCDLTEIVHTEIKKVLLPSILLLLILNVRQSIQISLVG